MTAARGVPTITSWKGLFCRPDDGVKREPYSIELRGGERFSEKIKTVPSSSKHSNGLILLGKCVYVPTDAATDEEVKVRAALDRAGRTC